MIQRIQSAYLLVAFLLLEFAASLLYVMPEIGLVGFRLAFAGLSALIGLGGLVSIFLFKKREIQGAVVGSLRLIAVVLVLGLWASLYRTGDLAVLAAGGFLGIAGILVAPLVATAAFHLARKAIQRDVDLIRSMDRIR